MPQLLIKAHRLALLQSVWPHQFREKGSAFLPKLTKPLSVNMRIVCN